MKTPLPLLVLVWSALLIPSSILAQSDDEYAVTIQSEDKKLVVSVIQPDGNQVPFTDYRYAEFAKPVLYPLYAPGQQRITRDYPMKEGVPDEASDHPHHKSVWFAHGDVNGVDFWSEKGTIRNRSVVAKDNQLTSRNEWMSGNEVIGSDLTTIQFSAGEQWRMFEYEVTLTASHGPIHLGDTKEGTFAVRTHPALRVTPSTDLPPATAFNSEGTRGKAIWGESARWVHYRGNIDGTPYTITIMDHPKNLRHPTTWHARDYGLIAANPFGVSYFTDAERGTGDIELDEGESLTLRYGVLMSRGKWSVEQIERWFERFTSSVDRSGR